MAGGEPLIPAELAPHHHAHDSHAHPPPHGAAAAAGSSAPSPPSHSRPSVQSESIGDLSGSVLSLRAGASAAGKGKKATGWRARLGLAGVARRTLGIVLLLVTVFMWTASNFLASVSYHYHWVSCSWQAGNAELTALVHLLRPHVRQALLCRLHQHFGVCRLPHSSPRPACA